MTHSRWSARQPLIIGFSGLIFLVLGVGFWAARVQIAGAVIATGVVEVENERQVVQHLDGGVIEHIFARDGDFVTVGDTLIELDGTFLRSELAIAEGQLAELFARKGRLHAERDGARDIAFGPIPSFTHIGEAEVQSLVSGQVSLFRARQSTAEREVEQILRQQTQIARQIEAFNAQLRAIERQLALIEDELADVAALFTRGLVQAARMRDLERSQAGLNGQIGALQAQIAEAETRSSALEIQALRLTDTTRERAITELRDLVVKERELTERHAALSERLSRLRIVAPASGTVFGSRVFARHAVIQPAEPVLYIIPQDQPLHVSARIDPADADQVFAQQEVSLVFSAFNRHTTPEGHGRVVRLSADAAVDETTGAPFYEAVVSIDDATRAALDGLALLPGMPVEAFIKTDDRTPLSYLVQPLTAYFSRAFREE